MTLSADDVVITGIGCVGPLGSDRETFWRCLRAGDCGVRSLTPADFHGLPLAEPCGFPLVGAPAAVSGASGEPVIALLMAAAEEAVAHAGLKQGSFDPLRAGCVIGTSKGGLTAFATYFLNHEAGNASSWFQVPPHAASSILAERWGLAGPCLAPVAACATGLVSVLRGCDLIRERQCDVVLAGSGDASLHPAIAASFRRMGVLASRFESPATACRPFNSDRDGFVIGEGAAVFILERRRHAEGRGVLPIVTVRGGSLLADPAGLTGVDPLGRTLVRSLRDTLSRSGVSAEDIGHVNLHGTATRTNDLAEAAALRAVWGSRTDSLPSVALKGAIGHLLGAAGSVELAATVLTIRDGLLPPTLPLTSPDPACRLALQRDVVPVSGFGLKVSLGFGGHVAVACLGPP